MSSPELHRRVDRQEEDLRAISDTLLDVQETVHGVAEVQQQHTTTLAAHGRDLAKLKATVDGHTETLAEHGRMLTEILALLRRSG